MNTPVASCTGTWLASRLWLSQCRAAASSNVVAASPSNVLTSSSLLLAGLAAADAPSWLAAWPSWLPDTSATGALASTSLASLASLALSVQPAAVQSTPSERTASVFMPGR